MAGGCFAFGTFAASIEGGASTCVALDCMHGCMHQARPLLSKQWIPASRHHACITSPCTRHCEYGSLCSGTLMHASSLNVDVWAMQACNRQTVYCVPLADSLNDSMVDFVIGHSGEACMPTLWG